ncbi:HAD family hydrolase [Companilactobacillus paralimentarius]|uniref:HAD family hydrolase n=1 Tax=Companilactobacillus paralimentarius TaxID=83526 RepID=UPI003850DFED
MKNIKLIATDIDGTLFDSNHEYNIQRLNNYINQLHQQNIKFSVASGNSYSHLEQIFQQTNNIDAIVAENGAQILVDGKTIYEDTLNNDELFDIDKELNSNLNIISLCFSGENGTYVNADSPQTNDYYINNLVRLEDMNDINDKIFKMNIRIDDKELDPTVKYINDNYGDTIHAAVSGFGSIDIISARINKATGIKELCDYYNISTQNVISFGDNGNDLEMLQESGIGVAMKNSGKHIQAEADMISVTDNDHDGVLNTIADVLSLET